MCGSVLCVAAVLVGVKLTAQPLPAGGIEYVLHVEPLALDSLRSGKDLHSDIPPPTLQDVRSLRITLAGDQAPAVFPAAGTGSAARGPGGAAPAESAADRGGTFATAPPGLLPMPKLDVTPRPWDRLRVPPASTDSPASAEQKITLAAPKESPTTPLGKQPAALTALGKQPAASKAASTVATEPEPPKESLGLLFSLGASTAGSFSGMVFFGWVAWDYRRRYLSLLRRVVDSPMEEEPAPAEDEPPAPADD